MESCVRGFHVYKDIWIPATGEVLSCKGEDGNIMNPYAVAIMKGSEIFGTFLARFQLRATFSYKRVGSLPALLQIAIINILLMCHKEACRFLVNWYLRVTI